MKYGAYFDFDGWPLAFVQASTVFLSVTRYQDSIAWRQHRTAHAATAQAKRDKGMPVAFNGCFGRWERIGQ